MIGCDVRAVRRRLLEYNNALPMREPLACLFTFAPAVCKREERRSGKWGCIATVEVERELETPQHLPPQAATGFSLRSQKAVANVNRRASGPDSADAHLYSSRRGRTARKAEPTKIFCDGVNDTNPRIRSRNPVPGAVRLPAVFFHARVVKWGRQ